MQPRVVAITGASSGIGRATAILFAQRGWRVGLIARSADTLADACKDVVGEGGTAAMATADVADSAQLEAAADQIEATLGPIDVWINNAGVSVYGHFLDIPEPEYRRLTETNYYGTVNGTRVALKRMQKRDRGTIVQVISAAGYRGIPLQAPYCASKWALRGFTEAVRAELVHQRSRVHLTMVHPPAVNTPFYNHALLHVDKPVRPPPPIYQPELIADAIHLAATTRRREVKVTEQTVAFALGNALAPGLLERVIGRVGVALQLSDRGGAVAERDPNLDRPGRIARAHGAFDAESLSVSPQLWLSRNRDAVRLGLGLIALAWLAGRRA